MKAGNKNMITCEAVNSPQTWAALIREAHGFLVVYTDF